MPLTENVILGSLEKPLLTSIFAGKPTADLIYQNSYFRTFDHVILNRKRGNETSTISVDGSSNSVNMLIKYIIYDHMKGYRLLKRKTLRFALLKVAYQYR